MTAPKPSDPRASQTCAVCDEYVARRMDVITLAIAKKALEVGVDAIDLGRRYMRSVHARHLAGLSLATGSEA